MDRALQHADSLVTSVFVNPIQFGPGDDFGNYPRDLDNDKRAAEGRGTDCLFLPSLNGMYPSEPVVRVVPGALADGLCGPLRPGHFEGVLTVVAKLFHMVEPDVAVFGRKDFQQARIISRMVSDLDFNVRIEIAPTVRETDGLALSSRNAYLSKEERSAAGKLSRGLQAAHLQFRAGVTESEALCTAVRRIVGDDALIALQYVEVVDPDTVEPVVVAGEDCVVAVAARVGAARLIDNIVLGQGVDGDERVNG
jgi:pantoate--beta-alanine ligase